MSKHYHHGDLRAAILAAAEQAVLTDGPNHLSLRALAREVGVTHTAPRHHFRDKRGVLTALAVDGYRQMREAIAAGREREGFLGAGVAYVDFARTHPAHFAVMFQADLVDQTDEALVAAEAALARELRAGVESQVERGLVPPGEDTDGTGIEEVADWAMAHGLATLIINGSLDTPAAELPGLIRDTLARLSAQPAPPRTAPPPAAGRR